MIVRLYRFVFLPGLLLLALLVACGGGGGNEPNAAATTDPDTPVRSDEPTPTQNNLPPGGAVITGTASVHSVDLLLLESFPLQMTASVKGDLPDGCTTIGAITQTRTENIITLNVATTRPADMVCTQALVPFTQNIGVDIYGLPAGDYTVQVNGVVAAFTLTMDNILPDQE
ncbi:MAG: hypothetical protein KA314_01475 [Chloroflexi bacterium]|nr:hypothetical protein [Chloroflexota bacterium]MBP8054478.1 hypothetical protein [Chloroflexota bacterium]